MMIYDVDRKGLQKYRRFQSLEKQSYFILFEEKVNILERAKVRKCRSQGWQKKYFTSKFPTLKGLSKKIEAKSLWQMCCGRANLGYSGTTLLYVLWTSYFGLLKDHFGECAVEELLWPTQGPFCRVRCGKATLGYSGLWRVCCGRATTLGYSGITLASVL